MSWQIPLFCFCLFGSESKRFQSRSSKETCFVLALGKRLAARAIIFIVYFAKPFEFKDRHGSWFPVYIIITVIIEFVVDVESIAKTETWSIHIIFQYDDDEASSPTIDDTAT